MHVVVPEHPSETMQYASRVFLKYWLACTGAELSASPVNTGRVNVWLGPETLSPDLAPPRTLEGLGPEGCIVLTFTPTRRQAARGAQKQLIISGATDKGTLNGVFEFFHQFLGIRWLAPGVVHAPRAPFGLPDMDYRFVPTFRFRECGYHDLLRRTATAEDWLEYRLAHKLNPEFLHGPFGGHTVYWLLPPDEYFDEHPEYYAEVGGKRVAYRGDWRDPEVLERQPGQAGQLCCGNPAVAEAVLASLIELIQADGAAADPELLERRRHVGGRPDGKVWSVSQMDWFGRCECPLCRAIDEREGTPMGSLLTLVNRVAEGLEEAFPEAGYKVHTFAYQYARKPPETIRPRHNVIVQLCTFECDFGRPLDDADSAVNAAFVRDLEDWSALTDNLYVWDYVANLAGAQRPHPNFHVLQSNAQLFDQYNVKGVYEQGWDTPGSVFSEFDALRSYLLSRCLWDPDFIQREAMSDFLRYYYEAAAPHIEEYIDLTTARVVNDGVYLSCLAEPYWLTYDLVTEAGALFEEAWAKNLSDAARRRVALARLPAQYAALVCPPRIRAVEGTFVLERPPSLTLEQFAAAMRLYGGGVKESPSYHPIQDITEECGGNTPPRREEHGLVVLENERYLLWVVPDLSGAAVRWRDKTLGVELLRGYEHYGATAGTWEDWVDAPHEPEGPVATCYAVVKSSAHHVMLRAALENGLVVTRTMRLPSGSEDLEVVLSVHNPTDRAATPHVKIHPEFFCQGMVTPEIWAEEEGVWTRLHGDMGFDAAGWDALYREPGVTAQWAFHVPGKKLTVANRFDAEQVGGLFFYYNTTHPRQQVNLELLMLDTPLAAGGSRCIKAAYAVHRRHPRDIGPSP